MAKSKYAKVLQFPSSSEEVLEGEIVERRYEHNGKTVIEIHHYHHYPRPRSQKRRRKGIAGWWESLPLMQKVAVVIMVLSTLAAMGGY